MLKRDRRERDAIRSLFRELIHPELSFCFGKVLVPVFREGIKYELISVSEVVSFEPINVPSGITFYMDFKYEKV